jgi:hypothetical protein
MLWPQLSVLDLANSCVGLSNNLSSLTPIAGMNATKCVFSSMLNPLYSLDTYYP